MAADYRRKRFPPLIMPLDSILRRLHGTDAAPESQTQTTFLPSEARRLPVRTFKAVQNDIPAVSGVFKTLCVY